MHIKTDYWAKPIPTREYDWSAIDADSYDGAPDSCRNFIGYGATECEAIAELMEQIAEYLNLHELLDFDVEHRTLDEKITFWCGRFGVHYCFECGVAFDDSYPDLTDECPDHMKCMQCRYGR